MSIVLDNFKIIRPRFETTQQKSLEWIARAHSYAKNNYRNDEDNPKNHEDVDLFMQKIVEKFCCNSEKISKRSSEVPDFLHLNFNEMKIFNLTTSKQGAPLQERMKLFAESTTRIFNEFYKNQETSPQDIIHVTCTGYLSPSAAQLLVSERKWGNICEVTHAYHMGCYASIPAIRMAQGFIAQANKTSLIKKTVDVVHTELCTLHFNPSLHTPEQFVIQSLFADGFIAYSLQDKNNYLSGQNKHAFEIIAVQEFVFPECADAMTWTLSDFGFHMTISRNVPSIIAENVEKFLEKMFACAELSYAEEKDEIIFAIHPGGPKIIEYVADILKLREDKVELSKDVLRKYGNMSSATLPHIWEQILQTKPEKNSLVASLAFGPGLTIAGCLMRII